MIKLDKIRELDLDSPPAGGRHAHLSAASGLVVFGARFYVVADDELHLGVFESAGPGRLIRLFDGVLAAETKARKKAKPDLEALTLLPPHDGFPNGALLAVGSGSKENRRRGALLGIDASGGLAGEPRAVDLSPLLGPLDAAIDGLNIEGAVADGDALLLFQRGTGADNAIVRFPLGAVFDVLAGASASVHPVEIVPVAMGTLDGIALGFTDACILSDGTIVFTAAAEDTDNAYDDGRCAGSVAGIVDQDGTVRAMHRFDGAHKIEGVAARADGGRIALQLVTDADDPDTAASLFAASLPR